MTAIALIVAAGRGTRVGAEVPKQYLPLAGRPLLRHSVETFMAHPAVDGVRVVIHGDDRARHDRALAGLSVLPPVAGGATRQASVRLGLESLTTLAPDRVLVHDAARPFIDAATVSRVLEALDRHSGAIPAVAVSDSLKRAENGLIAAHMRREGLFRAQTPQGFRFAEILAAHRKCPEAAFGDDAEVADAAGIAVALVAGSEDNFKVTEPADVARAERYLAANRDGDEILVGNGFDVHRFAPGDHVMLCGIAVPHDGGLEGHSDADVGLHALTDAILGAVGEGDIGQHFPPGDPRWKGAASHGFVSHARRLVEAQGGRITQVDVTLILERPRIGPHREAMRELLAELLGLPVRRVSVKATTTERLGFLGRGEGVAAQATATVRMPPR